MLSVDGRTARCSCAGGRSGPGSFSSASRCTTCPSSRTRQSGRFVVPSEKDPSARGFDLAGEVMPGAPSLHGDPPKEPDAMSVQFTPAAPSWRSPPGPAPAAWPSLARRHPGADQTARRPARRRHPGTAVVLEGPEVGRLGQRRRRLARQSDGRRPRREVRAGRGVLGHGDRRAAGQQDRHDVDDGRHARAGPGGRFPEDAAVVLFARRSGARRSAGADVGRSRQACRAHRRAAGEQHGQVPHRERDQGAGLALPRQRRGDRRLPYGRVDAVCLLHPPCWRRGSARSRPDRRADAARRGVESGGAQGRQAFVEWSPRRSPSLCERATQTWYEGFSGFGLDPKA